MAKLTEKQRRFAEHYAATGNGAGAARAAGYKGSDNTLAQVARENLRKPHVREFVESLRPETPDVADRAERQAFLTKIMRGQVNAQTKDEQMARLRACELLGKMQGDYVQRVEHTGPDGAPIEVAARESAEVRRLYENPEAAGLILRALETAAGDAG